LRRRHRGERPILSGTRRRIISDRANAIIVCRRTTGPAFGQQDPAFSDRNAMASGCSSTSERISPM
jgi:hypothetical protein